MKGGKGKMKTKWKRIGKTLKWNGKHWVISFVRECKRCNFRTTGTEKQCPYCAAIQRWHEEEAYAGII